MELHNLDLVQIDLNSKQESLGQESKSWWHGVLFVSSQQEERVIPADLCQFLKG